MRAPRAARAHRAVVDLSCVAGVLALSLSIFWVAERKIVGAVGLSSFPLDDAWIHLQFARNLADGRGFSYNAGVPVAGSTAPLWTVLLGAVFAGLGTAPGWAKALGIAAALGAALLARRLVRLWTGNRGLALVGGVLAALCGPLVWGALSGMEVTLAALLVTAALIAYVRGRDAACAVLLGAGVLARPETLLLVPLVWLGRPVTVRRTAVFACGIGGLLAPWLLFNIATAGRPLPATASAKIEGGLVGFLSGVREPVARALLGRPWSFETEWLRWLVSIDLLLPLLLVIGLWGLWRRQGRTALPAAILLLHPLGMAVLAPYRGPAFQEGRYSIHLLPLAIAVAMVGVAQLVGAPRPRSGHMWRRFSAPALAAALVAGAVWSLPGAAVRYAWGVQNIDAMQVALGRWLAAHTPAGSRLALNDVGAIAFVSRREVVDVMGLVTPAIIPYRRDGESGVLRYLERVCPDYLVIFPEWFPELSAMADRFRPIHRIKLAHNEVAGADEMVVYETVWNRWRAPRAPCGSTTGVRPRDQQLGRGSRAALP